MREEGEGREGSHRKGRGRGPFSDRGLETAILKARLVEGSIEFTSHARNSARGKSAQG